jgi:hypothetical protein
VLFVSGVVKVDCDVVRLARLRFIIMLAFIRIVHCFVAFAVGVAVLYHFSILSVLLARHISFNNALFSHFAGAVPGVEEGVEYVSDEDEDDPSQEDALFNKEFARKLSTRLWDENASNLPSLIPIKEGEKGVSPLGGSGATGSPALSPTVRKGELVPKCGVPTALLGFVLLCVLESVVCFCCVAESVFGCVHGGDVGG